MLVAAFAVRVVYCWTLAPYKAGDAIENIDNYHKYAHSIQTTFTFSLERGPSATREPGYPIFLAALYTVAGENYSAIWLTNCLFGALTVLLIFLIGKLIFSRNVAWAAALMASFYPQFVYYSCYPSRESLQVALLAAAIWTTLRACTNPTAAGFIGTGVLWALCPLTNSVFLPASVFAAGAVWLRGYRSGKDHRRWAAVQLAVCLTIYGLWPLRNFIVLGRFVPGITEGGTHLYTAFVVPNDVSGTAEESKFLAADPIMMEGSTLVGAEKDRFFYRAAGRILFTQPLRFAKVLFASFVKLWRFYPYKRDYNVNYRFVKWVSLLSDGWMIPLGLLGLILTGRRFPETDLINLTLFAVTTVYVIFWSTIRYRLPLMPYVILYASFTIEYLIEKYFPGRLPFSISEPQKS